MEHRLLDPTYDIITVPDVLTPAECDALIAMGEREGFTEAPISTGLGFVMAPEVRNNTRVIFDDPARAAALYARLLPVIPAVRDNRWVACGLNERFRFYRYDPGQRFAWHRDGAFRRSTTECSRMTVMVYLNDDFGGGETEFDPGPSVRPRRGMALLFAHPVRHQGAVVTWGRKYALRSDVMYTLRDATPAPG